MVQLVVSIITVGVIVTIAFLVLRVTKGGISAMFAKAAASACFIGTAFMSYAFNIEAEGYNKQLFEYGILMLLGLIFSLLGDIWLDLKYVHPDFSRQYTYAGFICFMLGHTFFIPAILMGYSSYSLWMIPLILGLCGVLVFGAFILEKINPNMDYGEYRPICFVYVFFVSGTMITAVTNLAVNGYSKKSLWLTIGAVAFLLSDFVLSSIYFEKNKNTKINVIINHTLYYFAQFAFASTLLFD